MVNDQYTICPNCSAHIPNNVNFCTKCGSPLEHDTFNTSSNQRPVRNVENDPVESIKESGQDFVNEMSNLFKRSNNKIPTHDGIHLEGSTKKNSYCPNCSATIPRNVNFCTECGFPVENKKTENIPDQSPIRADKTYKAELERLEYLEKLADLRDKEIITDDEFEKKKKDILKL